MKPTHRLSRTRIHRIWLGMRRRCYDKVTHSYERYGGRGIGVCEEWRNNSVAFIEWAFSHGYNENLTLDRIDSNKDYSPDNCRWVTPKEQSNHMSSNHMLTFNGKTQSLTLWAEELGIEKSTLSGRINRGWSVERAFTQPIQSHRTQKVFGISI